jgi:hypothetical protein
MSLENVLSRLFGWSCAAGSKAIMRLFGCFDTLTNERVQTITCPIWIYGETRADIGYSAQKVKKLGCLKTGDKLCHPNESEAHKLLKPKPSPWLSMIAKHQTIMKKSAQIIVNGGIKYSSTCFTLFDSKIFLCLILL